MRNALLIAALGGALLLLVWCWPGAQPLPDPPPRAAEPPLTAAPVARPVAPPVAATSGDAVELTRRARQQLDRDPAAALGDVARADQLGGADDPGRRALEIYALVRLGRVGEARALADRFYRAYPGHAESQRIESLTGYHPRPYGPGR